MNTTIQAIRELMDAHRAATVIARRLYPDADDEQINQVVTAELCRQLTNSSGLNNHQHQVRI